ncbi:MAG: DegT/DnrJ/EryC1/StrS family aminotransferase [Candidatus Anstonellaceae archaeon]
MTLNKKKISVGDFPIGEEEREVINEVLDKGHISEYFKVREFEKLWSKYIQTKYCVAVSSGTAALLTGWHALSFLNNYKSKKKVVTTPITYIATSSALILSGLEPVYVDIDPQRFIITPKNIEEHIKNVPDVENYLAINPVHLMGYVADMEKINKIAKKYNLIVVEDASQAHGSIYNKKRAGSFSLFSTFSFYIAHNIQVGEMGALNTNNEDIYRIVKRLKANGRLCSCSVCRRSERKCPYELFNHEDLDPRFTHDLIGYNFKTMEFQAALAVLQIKKIDSIIKKRQHNVRYLNDGLKNFSEILQLPLVDDNVSYLAYPIVIKNPSFISRKTLRKELEKYGIETRPLFGCIPTQQPAFDYLKPKYIDRLPIAEYIGKNAFYIGCHQYLTKDDLDYVIHIFGKIFNSL